jgi:hypothetical protein
MFSYKVHLLNTNNLNKRVNNVRNNNNTITNRCLGNSRCLLLCCCNVGLLDSRSFNVSYRNSPRRLYLVYLKGNNMQTLAQAHKFCGGQVPRRHTDAIYPCSPYLDSNIIFNIEGLFYLTFPQNQALPCGYEYFCTVQEFLDFVPPIELIDGKAYQFNYYVGKQIIDGIYISNDKGFITSKGLIFDHEATNIQLLTVGDK